MRFLRKANARTSSPLCNKSDLRLFSEEFTTVSLDTCRNKEKGVESAMLAWVSTAFCVKSAYNQSHSSAYLHTVKRVLHSLLAYGFPTGFDQCTSRTFVAASFSLSVAEAQLCLKYIYIVIYIYIRYIYIYMGRFWSVHLPYVCCCVFFPCLSLKHSSVLNIYILLYIYI